MGGKNPLARPAPSTKGPLSMIGLSPLVARAAKLGSRLLDAENALFDARRLALDLHARFDLLLSRLRPPEPPSTYVYVLDGTTGLMMAQRIAIAPSLQDTMTFNPMMPLPKGLWVVAVGPALVRDVFVGNQAQSFISNNEGQVCRTGDELPVGVLLRVRLEGR